MLRDKIREEHVARPAGARRDRGLHPVHRGRRNVRPADARVAAAREHGDEVVEPVGIGHAVAVRVSDHFAGRCVGTDIARVAEAHVFLHHAHEVRELPLELRAVRLPLLHDLLRVVLRAVVHEHDFKVGIAHIIERAQAVAERLPAVVAAHDHAHFRIVRERHDRGDRRAGAELCLQSVESLLWFPILRDEAEFPVRHFISSGEPLVRPGEKNRPCRAALHDDIEVPVEHFGLPVLAVAQRVHAEFAEDQRLFLGDVLQPREVALEVRAPFEIHI